jgi:hypothetical protein
LFFVNFVEFAIVVAYTMRVIKPMQGKSLVNITVRP